MKRKYILLSVTVAVMLAVAAWLLCSGEPVDSKEEAVRIAQTHVWNEYGQDFTEYQVNAVLAGNTWIVSYGNDSSDKSVLGGGGPVVRIDQANGRVISCLLQK